MLRTQRAVRILGPGNLAEVTELLARDPVVNVVTDYRARTTQLHPRWLNGQVWGYYVGQELVSVCHVAANLMPAMASPEAVEQFAERALQQGRRSSTIVGPDDAVDPLWESLRGSWGPAREIRTGQPHLEIDRAPQVAPDPKVRLSTKADLDALYPACVRMYTEEVGVSPEADGGAPLYRARVAQLISRGWSFVRLEHGRVVFKAEVAAATPHACQVQGVWVDPARRGEGLGAAGMAAVVHLALQDIAPVVSLYVNSHNLPARRIYARVGFAQTATFTTVMF